MSRPASRAFGTSGRAIPFPGGARIFQRMFTRLGCRGRPPHFVVEFYPYRGLTHTIRLRRDSAFVRLSDLLRSAPPAALEAAAAVLLAKMYRRRLPRDLARVYREFALAAHTRRRMHRARGRRARPLPDAPRGAVHDLGPMFDALNRLYFAASPQASGPSPETSGPRPRLAWSLRPWRRQLGSFDPALNQIVISSSLDRPGIPARVVEYILFHEMLHVKHPSRRAGCGLQSHSPGFRREEKRYPHFAFARRFLKRMR